MGKTKFWLEDPSELLQSFKLFPSDQDTIEEKINAITRIVVIVFIIMLITKQKHATTFLIIALIVTALAYYYHRSQNPSDLKCHKEENHEEERFMAHAGNDKEINKPRRRPHPRRPYPNNLPEDFVVRNPGNNGYADISRADLNEDSDPRHSYLVALRRKAEALEREEEIARLESKLSIGNYQIPVNSNKVEEFEYDEVEYYEQEPEEQKPIPKRVYLDVGEEDPDVTPTLFSPHDTSRKGFRFGMRKRAPDPRRETKVDPTDLMLNRQRQIYGQNREISNRERKAMMNNV